MAYSRRAVIFGGAALAALAGGAYTLYRLPNYLNSCLRRRAKRDLSVRIGMLIGHRDSAAVIGERYLALAERPSERSPHALTAAMGRDMQIDLGTLDALGDAKLGATIARQITADFEHERVVSISGWLLSRTEARICALAALTWPGLFTK